MLHQTLVPYGMPITLGPSQPVRCGPPVIGAAPPWRMGQTPKAMFNIEVLNTYQMPCWLSCFVFVLVLTAFHKNVLCKVSTLHNEGLFKIRM